MSSDTSSTCGTNCSVESSTRDADTGTPDVDPPASTSPIASSSTREDVLSLPTKRSTTRDTDTGLSEAHPPSSTSSGTSFVTREDDSNLSAERITAYTNNPSDPNPTYFHASSKGSIAKHTDDTANLIKDFDATMSGHCSPEWKTMWEYWRMGWEWSFDKE